MWNGGCGDTAVTGENGFCLIQAVATIFNKDIVLVPAEGEQETVRGGIDGKSGKGSPLYLGHIKGEQGKNKDVFISILPDRNHVTETETQTAVRQRDCNRDNESGDRE